MEFKDNLKKLRKEKELTQNQLADEIFVSRSLIAKWENGLGLPSEETLKLLCDYFNVDKGALIPEVNIEKTYIKKNREINKLKYYLLGVASLGLVIIIALSILLIIDNINDKKNVTLNDAPKIKINGLNCYRVTSVTKEESQIAYATTGTYSEQYFKNMITIQSTESYEVTSNDNIIELSGKYFYLDEEYKAEEKEVQLNWYNDEENYIRYDLTVYDNTFYIRDVKEEYSYVVVELYLNFEDIKASYLVIIEI